MKRLCRLFVAFAIFDLLTISLTLFLDHHVTRDYAASVAPSTFAQLQRSEATGAIPVVFLTAKVQAADRRRTSDLGAHGIIAKPFDPMNLAGDGAAIVGW